MGASLRIQQASLEQISGCRACKCTLQDNTNHTLLDNKEGEKSAAILLFQN